MVVQAKFKKTAAEKDFHRTDQQYINGKWVDLNAKDQWNNVYNPTTKELVSKVTHSDNCCGFQSPTTSRCQKAMQLMRRTPWKQQRNQ